MRGRLIGMTIGAMAGTLLASVAMSPGVQAAKPKATKAKVAVKKARRVRRTRRAPLFKLHVESDGGLTKRQVRSKVLGGFDQFKYCG